MQQLQDTDIIQLVLKGEQQAFSVLVERYRHFVFTLALKYASGREEAEELAQDVFVKAYRSPSGFRGNSKFSTWLYTITHTTCLSHLRKNKPAFNPINENHHNIPVNMVDRIEIKSRQYWLVKVIEQLEQKEAEAITLFYLAEQSVEEIALITGQSAANVKVRLFRARQKLKQLLTHQHAISRSDL